MGGLVCLGLRKVSGFVGFVFWGVCKVLILFWLLSGVFVVGFKNEALTGGRVFFDLYLD